MVAIVVIVCPLAHGCVATEDEITPASLLVSSQRVKVEQVKKIHISYHAPILQQCRTRWPGTKIDYLIRKLLEFLRNYLGIRKRIIRVKIAEDACFCTGSNRSWRKYLSYSSHGLLLTDSWILSSWACTPLPQFLTGSLVRQRAKQSGHARHHKLEP